MYFARRRLQAATLALRLGICRSAYSPGYTSWRISRSARRKRNVPVLSMMHRRCLAGIFFKEHQTETRKGVTRFRQAVVNSRET